MNDERCPPRFLKRSLGRSAGRLAGAVPGRDLEASHQQDVHHLVIIRLVMTVNEHLTPARSQGNGVFVLNHEPAAVGHVDHKRAKRSYVQQVVRAAASESHPPSSTPRYEKPRSVQGRPTGRARANDPSPAPPMIQLRNLEKRYQTRAGFTFVLRQMVPGRAASQDPRPSYSWPEGGRVCPPVQLAI